MATFIVDLYSFSPDNHYLACYNHTERKILIRKCETTTAFKVHCQFPLKSSRDPEQGLSCVPVNSLQWSQDSQYLAASCKRWAVISIFSVTDSNWRCRVSLGAEVHGLESFVWGGDARHVLCLAGDMTFLSVWSISTNKVQYIKSVCPLPSAKALSFSPDGSQLAVGHMTASSPQSPQPYYLAIYSTSKSTWKLDFQFSVKCKDLAGVSWSKVSEDTICLWDSTLYSNLYVYSHRGALLKHYSPYGMSSCGFDTVMWTAGGELVCTVHNRNELHVLNGLTFGILIHDVLEPEMALEFGDQKPDLGQYEIFVERNKCPSLGMNLYVRVSKWPSLPLDSGSLLTVQTHSPKPTTRVRVSPDGSLLACSTRFYPQVVWIYDLTRTATLIAVLIHQHPVADFTWNNSPRFPSNLVVIVCSSTTDPAHRALLYFWTAESKKKSDASAYIHNTSAKVSFCEVQWKDDVMMVRDNLNRIHLFSNL